MSIVKTEPKEEVEEEVEQEPLDTPGKPAISPEVIAETLWHFADLAAHSLGVDDWLDY